MEKKKKGGEGKEGRDAATSTGSSGWVKAMSIISPGNRGKNLNSRTAAEKRREEKKKEKCEESFDNLKSIP